MLCMGQTQAKVASLFLVVYAEGLYVFSVIYELLKYIGKRHKNVTLSFNRINAEFEASKLTLVFSQVVEMSRCLCRSGQFVFSSFTTKKLRQKCH